MLSPKTLFAAFTLLALAGCGNGANNASATQEEWNQENDPLQLSGAYQRTLTALPLEGKLDTTPWTDTYWPSYQGGLAARWKTSTDAWTYQSPSLATLQTMTMADKARLSPAEKYDAFTGKYNYPLVSSERSRTNPNKPTWEGICHGWAPAAIVFDEPKPVLLTGANGVQIPFGSSDIKGLLSLLEGNHSGVGARMLGGRCYDDFNTNPDAAISDECRDTNAGAFHVVVTNQLGLMKKGFLADVTRDAEVWNQPIHGFKTKIVKMQEPSVGAAPGTVQEAVIETQMTYTVEVNAQWNALVGTPGHADHTKSYKYRVELDQSGAIIGGEWEGEDRPDFLWVKGRAIFQGKWTALKTIYEQSLTSQPLQDPTL